MVLVNQQEARLFMPVGGAVSAAGALVVGSPGLTVSKSGSTYAIAHPGHFSIPSVVPSVTVAGAGATVTALASTADQTVVTLSADSAFWFTLQPVRRQPVRGRGRTACPVAPCVLRSSGCGRFASRFARRTP